MSHDLPTAIRAPGFTPSAREVDAVVELLADKALAKAAERALGRAGAPAMKALLARADAPAPLRGRVVRALGRFVDEAEARARLLAALEDEDPKARRSAVIALGKRRTPEVEAALLALWDREEREDLRRSIAASLGKVGGPRALEALSAAPEGGPELREVLERARLMLERDCHREEGGAIDASRAPARPLQVLLRCRRGLEPILAEESGGRPVRPGAVALTLRGPLAFLYSARTFVDVAFPLPFERVGAGEDPADAAIRAIASKRARQVFETWTVGPARYRVAFASGGHRRALVWKVARGVAARSPALVNDPTESLWEATIREVPGGVEVELSPRALEDPRFTYRQELVRASSHPTIAAALARVAGAGPGDVVWDPFVGSGAELVERSLAGPSAALLGSDTDPAAIEAARANLAAAGVEASLRVADALTARPRGVTLILTNPPMGRRVLRDGTVRDVLDRFVDHAARVLRPGGRLVWVSPFPARSLARARKARLVLERRFRVDMGGFNAELQRLCKPT